MDCYRSVADRLLFTLGNMSRTFKDLEEMVNNVYAFREHYYKSHPNADAETKRLHIEEELNKAITVIHECMEQCDDQSVTDMLLYLKGKLINISPKFYCDAEQILTRHVKFYPLHLEAWNVLGECFWKKNDVISAKNCFVRSLELRKNSTALRCLSMLFRTLKGTKEEVSTFMIDSLRMAREAVAHDVNDGKNWYVLGNVFIAMYFKTDQDPNWLKQAIKAYTNASRHENVKNDPDFHFNRGVAYSYDEDFEQAFLSYEMASKCDPNWAEPPKYISNLKAFLQNCKESIATRGKIKTRKMRELLKDLKPKHIGMYVDGITKKENDNIVNVPLTKCSLSALQVGMNLKKVVLGKVVCHVYSPDPVTFTFCMIEDDGPCYAVNVYNIAEGRGVKIGDSVAIPEPYVHSLDFKYNEEEYKFKWIRVDDPLLLVVNGRPMGSDNRAVPVLRTVFNPE